MPGFVRPLSTLFGLLSLLAAAPAGALELPFSGTLTLQIFAPPMAAPFAIEGVGVAEADIGASNTIESFDLPDARFATAGAVAAVTDPSAFPVVGLQAAIENQAGFFARVPGPGLGGEMPLRGTAKVCLYGGTTPSGGNGGCGLSFQNVTVPLSVIGRSATAYVAGGVVNMTVVGAPWTTGTIEVDGPGSVDVSAMGSEMGSNLNLVTPVFISTNIGAFSVVRPYARLELLFGSPDAHCQNGVDDDGDGFADFPGDPGCASIDDPSERSGTAPCDDGIDNDSDFRIDFADPGCEGPGDTSEVSDTIACDDGIDNDGDGFLDFPGDPGCSAAEDESERGIRACDDGLDDDADGFADQTDPGCVDAYDLSERGPGLVCDNGIDDDLDLAVDYPDDPGCASIQDPSERTASLVCDDGLDNDGDGFADYRRDPGCSGSTDASEKSNALACDDGLDNDFDGRRDFPQDPGCSSPGDTAEQSMGIACDDGLDNDGDGAIDSQQDPGCDGPGDARESVDLADGGVHWFGPADPIADSLTVDLGVGGAGTQVHLEFGSSVSGDVWSAGNAFVRVDGAAVAGNLIVTDAAEIEILAVALGGSLDVRDAASVTIRGSGFDLPLGSVAATEGILNGYLLDGTPIAWTFTRDVGASIVLAPEPGPAFVALAAFAALAALRRAR